MREYLLYIKTGQDSIHAYVTPCFQVDRDFWQQREGCQLHVMGRTPSLALAFSIRERLNLSLQEEWSTNRPMNEEMLERLRRLAFTCVRESNALYGRKMAAGKAMRKSWFSWEDGARKDSAEKGEACVSAVQKDVRQLLAGRALLWEEIEMLVHKQGERLPNLERILHQMVLAGEARWLPGVQLFVKRGWLRHTLRLTCSRCGSGGEQIELTICHTCGQGCAYCTACLGMGRSKCCTPYVLVPDGLFGLHTKHVSRLAWTGRYSRDQAIAAERARRFVASVWNRTSEFLIWAVCGAGKTELLFPSVEEALSRGDKVLIATPRKDVVLELAPRLEKVFPEAKVTAVHGSSKEKWEDSDIAIATTHQVLRYYERFFLVVLDEVDAFPYHNNPILYRALSRAVRPGGKLLYLSATPPRYLQKRLVTKSRFLWAKACYNTYSSSHVLLPGRYHGHELPVPQIRTVQGLNKRLKAGRAIQPLIDMVRSSLAADRQVFLFVPRIEDVGSSLAYMQAHLPEYADVIAGVHAADPLREEKVLSFRKKSIKLMVTTTILERGVTIPGSDVVVVGAQAAVFDEASLVQIAGRVGRSPDDPKGKVLFLQAYRAKAPYAAVRQITQMNQLAKQLSELSGKEG